ncbi:MAG: glucuronate isomerase [Ruminococcus sp.]|nr:glucuronate isomerase [Candidatus Copronaster equi]
MKNFMDKDFLLYNDTAKKLFHENAEQMPIFDWHCHLSPKEIYENKQPENIAELWLGGDHYKWRAMRGFGIDEKYITGDASDYEKFQEWAKVMPYCVGNPLYHWTHLELQRYFDIYEPLSEKTCDEIWEKANSKIKQGGFTPRQLIVNSNVTHICTTDDAADTLEYHKLLQEDDSFKCTVVPAFRPDKALDIDKATYIPWVKALENVSGEKITTYTQLTQVLKKRIDFFAEMGCRASDHSFSFVYYNRATEDELNIIFQKAISGEKITKTDEEKYRTELFRFFAKEYARFNWGCEIHIGAMRNNNTAMFNKIGADTGFDSIGDSEIAVNLSRLLDSLAVEENLPKTILFTLNPKDNYVLGSMLGNFQSSEAASKIQFGSAWWFNDNLEGMREQLKALANLGVLGKFVGMVTDSRSFLSYPRHEYFRRILCGLIGDWIEQGLYPYTDEIDNIIKGISYNNSIEYFGMK